MEIIRKSFFVLWLLFTQSSYCLFNEMLGYYKEGDEVKINVGRISSSKTQIPFNFHKAFYCKGTKNTKRVPIEDNIGEILMGDRIFTTDYDITLLHDEYCGVLCEFNYDSYHEHFLQFLIDNNYHASYYVDGLPASFVNFENNKVEYQGVPLGRKVSEGNKTDYILYNHLTFHIELQKEEDFIIDNAIEEITNTEMYKEYIGGEEESEKDKFLYNKGADYRRLRNLYQSYDFSNLKKAESSEHSKYSIRKFQITPFSVSHKENDQGDLEAGCFRKDYSLTQKSQNTTNTYNNTTSHSVNINFTNYHKQYEKDNDYHKQDNSTSSNNNDTNKVYDVLIDNENFHPSVNSEQDIENFRSSLVTNFLTPNAYIKNGRFLLTYDIKFTISKKPAKLVSRWDHYIKMTEKDSIHWWSLINSSIAITVTSLIIMIIFSRVIRRDIDYIQLVRFFIILSPILLILLMKLGGNRSQEAFFFLPKTDISFVLLRVLVYSCFL